MKSFRSLFVVFLLLLLCGAAHAAVLDLTEGQTDYLSLTPGEVYMLKFKTSYIQPGATKTTSFSFVLDQPVLAADLYAYAGMDVIQGLTEYSWWTSGAVGGLKPVLFQVSNAVGQVLLDVPGNVRPKLPGDDPFAGPWYWPAEWGYLDFVAGEKYTISITATNISSGPRDLEGLLHYAAVPLPSGLLFFASGIAALLRMRRSGFRVH